MEEKKLQLCSLVSFYLVASVMGYSLGPPPSACDNMTPGHPAPAQTVTVPYEIVLAKTTYSANENIQVTLQGKNGTLFKGFMIQPRSVINPDATHGTISGAPAGTFNPCNGRTALSHTNNNDKTSVGFTWIAPASNVSNIVFVYTVVQRRDVYWVTQTSTTLTYQASTTPVVQNTTQASTTPVVQNTTQATTAPVVQNTTQATTNTGAQNTTQTNTTESSQNITQVSVTASVQNTTQATTTAGGTQNTTQATTTAGGTQNTTQATTTAGGTQNTTQATITAGGTQNTTQASTIAGGTQTITQAKTTAGGTQNTTQATTIVDVQNTTQATTTVLNTPITLTTTVVRSTQAATTKPPMGITKDNGCGKTVGCFHDCDSSNACGFLLTWVDNGDNIDLNLSCRLNGGDVYCAIGLSSDDKMGDDSVLECVSSSNQVAVYVSYNNGRSNSRLDQAQLGITSFQTEQKDGVLTCKFSRKKTFSLATVTTGRKKRETASDFTYFDMNKDWTLIYAYGKSFSGYLQQHDKIPTRSSQVADFQSVMDISATEADHTLVKAHGILMTLAWLFFATLGIFMARFYKTVWPEGMECCNQKRWFQVHRALMVLTLLITAAAFIIIFVHVRGYADMEDDDASNFDKSHPIIGIIIMGLVVINPIMALFRPHPGTPRRQIFNVAHTFVGVSAHILGIVNLFSGTGLSDAHTPSYVWILLYIFVAWILFIEFVSHLYERNKKEPKANAYELKSSNPGVYLDFPDQSVSRFKLAILGIHVIVLNGLAIAVCVIIGIN